MKNGIYHVTFSSSSNDFGEGIAVFKGDTVNGGDYGYLYIGTKSGEGDEFKSTLTIKQWNPAAESIFGPAKQFDLELSGESSAGDAFTAQGHVVGEPQARITIRGEYLSDAA